MTEQEEKAFQHLSKQVPNGYRINELIYFSYPVRRIMLQVQANKQPDQTLARVYQAILKTIKVGISHRDEVFHFLGIDLLDEFMARELIQMRELGLVDFNGQMLVITTKGEEFVRDNSFLRVIESEKYTFLLDGLSDEVISYHDHPSVRYPLKRKLEMRLIYGLKSPDLLKGKSDAISELYKRDHGGNAYLVGYEEDKVMQDYNEWLPLMLIEYVPTKGSRDPRIEIRRLEEPYSKVDSLTKLFNQEYRHLLFELTESDRPFAQEDLSIITLAQETIPDSDSVPTDLEIENLGVWETKRAFEKVLSSTVSRLLIESPWIKVATQQYLPAIEQLAKNGVKIYILFGIDENTDHHHRTMRNLENLAAAYPSGVHLVNLPEHFHEVGITGRHGTHRKLVIKDDELYISGSFNFLSFNMREGDSIANEETYLIRRGVGDKWRSVIREYRLEDLVSTY